MFLHKYEPKYNLYLNICSNINKIKKRFKKELRNQSLKEGFDYVAPFLKNNLIQNFVMMKFLHSIMVHIPWLSG